MFINDTLVSHPRIFVLTPLYVEFILMEHLLRLTLNVEFPSIGSSHIQNSIFDSSSMETVTGKFLNLHLILSSILILEPVKEFDPLDDYSEVSQIE